jgi:hypothetical protein
MGGDEFVVIAPGLTPEATARKAEQMRDLVHRVGQEVCNEDILSLSVGKAVYPEDGLDAEKLLSEADRRMYLQKLTQATHKNRRVYPRAKGRITTEILLADQPRPMLGIVTNLSMGGCYVETSGIMLPGARATLAFSFERTAVSLQCEVVRMDMGIGAALKFAETTHESRDAVQHILDQLTTAEAHAERQRSLNAAAGTKT